MFNKFTIIFLFLIIKLVYSMLRGPMPQTKEKEGRPQFWSFNQPHPSLPTTTEIPISSEDYYDAIKEEDELKQKEKTKEDDISSALHLMTALHANINPLFPILPVRKANKEEKVI